MGQKEECVHLAQQRRGEAKRGEADLVLSFPGKRWVRLGRQTRHAWPLLTGRTQLGDEDGAWLGAGGRGGAPW